MGAPSPNVILAVWPAVDDVGFSVGARYPAASALPKGFPACKFDSWDAAAKRVNHVRKNYLTWMGLSVCFDGWTVHDEVVFGNPYCNPRLLQEAIGILLPLIDDIDAEVDFKSKLRLCADLHYSILSQMKKRITMLFFTWNDENHPISILRFSASSYKRVLTDEIFKILPNLVEEPLTENACYLTSMLARSFVADTRPLFAREFPLSVKQLMRLTETFLLSQHDKERGASAVGTLPVDCLQQIIKMVFVPTDDSTLRLHQQIAVLFHKNRAITQSWDGGDSE